MFVSKNALNTKMKKVIFFTLAILSALLVNRTMAHNTQEKDDNNYFRIKDLIISIEAKDYLTDLGIELKDDDIICINDAQAPGVIRIRSFGESITDYFLLSFSDNEGKIESCESLLSLQGNHLGYNPAIPYTPQGGKITIVGRSYFTSSGDLFTGVYYRPYKVDLWYSKNVSCTVQRLKVEYSSLGDLYNSSNICISESYTYTISKEISFPIESEIYMRNLPLREGYKLLITGELGTCMTLNFSGMINGAEFNSSDIPAMPIS